MEKLKPTFNFPLSLSLIVDKIVKKVLLIHEYIVEFVKVFCFSIEQSYHPFCFYLQLYH